MAIHTERSGLESRGERESLGALFGDLGRELTTLVRQEVELAKTEVREEAAKAGRAGGMVGLAAVAGWVSIVLVSFALAWGLAEVMAPGLAFLIVGVLYAVAGVVLFAAGRQRFQEVRAVPEETVDTLQEDVRWARAQLR